MRKIIFPAKGLTLENYINIIYFNKTNLEFDDELSEIINFLRKYSKKIREIGYLNYLEGQTESILVLIKINISTLSKEEQQLLSKINLC